ncbi:MAG: twin-arginine translocase TatA/TatE family subunit [Anaerolineales bacterium]|nr:twin-arginine translocase TatA/TatE family subunit [Anaerolineales bacterium]
MDLNVLGIGLPELLFFAVLLLLLFGPNDLARMARDIGRFIARVTRSPNFQTIQQASQELRNLPQRIVQEAQLEDIRRETQQLKDVVAGPLTPPPPKPAPPTVNPSSTDSPFRAWMQELPAESVPQPTTSDSKLQTDADRS